VRRDKKPLWHSDENKNTYYSQQPDASPSRGTQHAGSSPSPFARGMQQAEDILHDVFVSLTTKTNKNEAPDNVASWLYSVTRNRIIDYYRANKFFDELPDELVAGSDDIDVVGQLSKCMLPMIKALPETYQQVLTLSEVDGEKNRDIADELGLSLSAVKSRILRGRQSLHESMVRCCKIHINTSGDIVDYEQKGSDCCKG